MSHIKWFSYKERISKTDIYATNENSLNLSPLKFIAELDQAWFNFFVRDAPQGKVLTSNTYKKDFDKIRIVHLTPSFDKIIEQGTIFASGGGLGAAIYGSPLHNNGRVHNILEQYLCFQLPITTTKNIVPICIEIHPKEKNNIANWGADYTDFGELQRDTWEELKKNCDSKFISEFEERVYRQIVSNKEWIDLFLDNKLNELSPHKFEKAYENLFTKVPSLRFILYEILAEYILLYQDNKNSSDYARLGELYNLTHKKFIFDLCPDMLRKFNMVKFYISLNDIISYLSNSDIFLNFNSIHFRNILKWRISFYLRKISLFPIKDSIKDFNELSMNHPSLVGQVVYREFYDKNIFEKERSKLIYRLWQRQKIICPIYSILPKGEVGINPNLDELGIDYTIFKAEFNKKTRKIKLLKKIKVKICSSIIDKSLSTVR